MPCTLLDLRTVDAVTKPLERFVAELGKLDKNLRGRLIGSAAAGDPALVDVLTVCKNFPKAKSASALKLAIKQHVVAHASRTHAFTGVSLFYSPPGSARRIEGLVAAGVFPFEYAELRLSDKTTWDRLAFENNK